MKNLFKIAALVAALGLAAAISACSNGSDGGNVLPPAAPVLPTTAPAPTTTPGSFTVSFDANDGSQTPAKATQIFTAGVPQKLTPVAELGFKRDNFNFAGWALSSAASQAAYVDGAEYTGNISITLYAVWTKIIYTVTFDYNNGSEAQTQSVASGQPAAKPADPTKDHFNFAGWCSDAECQTPFDFSAPITAPTTLYAKWSDRPVYIVTFELNGGKYGSSDTYTQNVEEGAKAIRPASAPAKDDYVSGDVTTKYTFDNWYADAGCGTLFDFDATVISGPTTIYAKWNETNTYVVTFDLGGGKYGSDDTCAQNVEIGSKVMRPVSVPTKDDKVSDGVTTKYTFDNWYADSGCGTLFDFDATTISGSTTIYAKWSETKYYSVTIACNSEHGTISTNITEPVVAGTLVTLTARANPGYKFASYTVTDPNSSPVLVTYGRFTMPASPVTVKAIFTAIEYTITCGTSENGTVTSVVDKATIGTTVTLTVSASAGYELKTLFAKDSVGTDVSVTEVFAGASYSFTMPAGNVYVMATFSPVPLTLEAIEAGTKVTIANHTGKWIICRVNDGEVQNIGVYAQITLPNAGDKVCFFGDNATYAPSYDSKYHPYYSNIACDKDCYVYGNIMSLIDSENYENAKTLTKEYAFKSLFANNRHIKNKPGVELALPATTLTSHCYDQMFVGCTGLTSAPALPATTLVENCYIEMFNGCISLASAPSLPATTLAKGCYKGMFYNCKNITSAPALSATTLMDDCYCQMFYGCASLTSAPALPATTLTDNCYCKMFDGCTSLTSAPTLPATVLAASCYESMFKECVSLTKAPALPVTTLADMCYSRMFSGCAKLTSAPALPATTLATGCYSYMFEGCASLARAPTLPATTLESDCYEYMFVGCTRLTSAPTLPATTLASCCYYGMFCRCGLVTAPELPVTTLARGCYHSMFTDCKNLMTAPELPATTLATGCYLYMFKGCTSLTSTPKLLATTLAVECYYEMFEGCTSLTMALDLPATTLANKCYCQMFVGCTSLTRAPKLPATTLAESCYSQMFDGCTKLASAPTLPATTLASNCYSYMFRGCAKLTSAPALPATTLAVACYDSMFYGCTNLASVTCLATDKSAGCTNSWLRGVKSTGTFKRPSGVSWSRGADGIPDGWTVVNY